MKGRKIVSIVISLAMVFSMSMAFAVTAYADGGNEDIQTNSDSATPAGKVVPVGPNTIMVNGYRLTSEKPYLSATGSEAVATKPSDNYAYYNDGTLVLHNFKLSGLKNSIVDAYGNYGKCAIATEEYVIPENKKVDSSSGDPEILDQEPNTLYIELEGTNEIAMDESNKFPAIYAPGLRVIVSSNDGKASLDIETSRGPSYDESVFLEARGYDPYGNPPRSPVVASVYTGGFELMSGEITIDSNSYYCNIKGYFNHAFLNFIGDTAIFAESDNVTISGGNLTINDAFYAIMADDRLSVTGGTITTDDCYYGLWSDNEINISGGNIFAKDCCNPIYAYDSNINISGGNTSINDLQNPKQFLTENATVEEALEVDIQIAEEFNPYDTFGGELAYGVNAYNSSINISGGNLVIKHTNENPCYGVRADENFKMTGGKLVVSGVDWGLYCNEDLDISNATIDINVKDDGLWTWNSQPTIKNSDVKVLSTGTEYGSLAFWSNPSISGTPAIYAGDSEATAKRIAAGTDLTQYQYVHIYKNSSVILSKLSNIFTKLLSTIFGLNSGSTNNSVLWKYFETLFKLF